MLIQIPIDRRQNFRGEIGYFRDLVKESPEFGIRNREKKVAVRWHTLFHTLGGVIAQAYRARRPQASPLWQCLSRHFNAFLEIYEERYQPRYGYLRPVIPEVVRKFLE